MSIGRTGMFVIPFMAYYLDKGKHLSVTDVAFVIAALGLGTTVGDAIGGYLADIFGRRLAIVLGNLAAAAAYIWLGRADTVHSMVIAALAVGLCYDLWRPGAYAILEEASSDEEQLKRANSLFLWFFNAAVIAAAIGAGFLAVTVGWIWLFYGNAVACICFALVARFALPESRPERRARRTAVAMRPRYLLVLALLTLVCLTAYNQIEYALPLRFAGDGIEPVEYGVILAVNPITVCIVQLTVWGKLKKMPSVAAFAVGMLFIGVGIAITGMGHGFIVHGIHVSALAWFCGTSLIWILGEIAVLGPGMALVTGLAPPGKEASYTGIFFSAVGLSTITASVAGAWIIHLPGLRVEGVYLSGLPLLWTACAAAGVVASTGILVMARPFRRRVSLMKAAEEEIKATGQRERNEPTPSPAAMNSDSL